MEIDHYIKKIQCEKGFSLFEIIVIIVIIGILATVAIAHYNNLSNIGKVTVCKANQFSIETAQKLYLMDHLEGGSGHFATSLEQLRDYSCFHKDEIPVCPLGGSYILHSWGGVTCTISSHN